MEKRLFWFYGFYALLVSAVFAGSLFSPRVRALSYAPLRELILPPPEPVTLSMLYSTEKEAWLQDAVEQFYLSNPEVDGHPVQIEMEKMGSREIYLAVLEGDAQPALISPASFLQISLLEDLSAVKFGFPLVKAAPSDTCRSLVETPLVLVAWRERADVLWGNQPPDDWWHSLHDDLTDPAGWDAYQHPEWGYIKFGHTNPLKSNSGLMTLVLMTYGYHQKTSGLTAQDVLADQDFQAWLLEMEGAVSTFGDSTGTYMKDIVVYGPSVYDIVSVYEATAIEQAENAVGRYGELSIYYPPATVMSDHPLCLLEADWVSPQQTQAAQLFIDFLLSEQMQTAALLQYGFRPANQKIDLTQSGSPFNQFAAMGLQRTLPPEVQTPPGVVLNTLLDFWSRNVKE